MQAALGDPVLVGVTLATGDGLGEPELDALALEEGDPPVETGVLPQPPTASATMIAAEAASRIGIMSGLLETT